MQNYNYIFNKLITFLITNKKKQDGVLYIINENKSHFKRNDINSVFIILFCSVISHIFKHYYELQLLDYINI